MRTIIIGPVQVTARWAAWDGAAFTKEADSVILYGRETAKLYMITLPSGTIQRLKKFDRAGRCHKTWRVWYGGVVIPRSYIDIALKAVE